MEQVEGQGEEVSLGAVRSQGGPQSPRDGLQQRQSRSQRWVSELLCRPRPAPFQNPAQTPEERKPKSVPEPEPGDTGGGATSPLPSEWTSVRISPGEDGVGQDVLAVRVLVTSEDSSSDAESDYGSSEASSAKPCEGRAWQPESPPLQKPLTRHISLREPLTRADSPQCLEELQAAHALQRANSFQAPTPSKHQNWRRRFQSNLQPMNKRTLSSPKEPSPLPLSSWSSPSSSPPSSSSSASVPGHTPDDSSPSQVAAYNPHSQVSRGHSSPSTPIFLRRARAQGTPMETPLYLPHGAVLERAEYCLVSPGGDSVTSPVEMASEDCEEAEAPLGGTKSLHKDPYPIGQKDRCLTHQEQSLVDGKEPREERIRPRRQQEGRSELAEERKSGLKKLVLTQEQKTMLLDWNDSIPETVHLRAEEPLSQDSPGGDRPGRVLKPVHPLTLPRAWKQTLPAQREAQEETRAPAVRTPAEQGAPPKSPLRLIANALRKSLGNFFPNSEGGKKAWAKSESKTLPTDQPHTCTRSFSLRKTSSNKEGDQQSSGTHVASRASAFFSLGSEAAQFSRLSPSDPALCAHSLPNRPSKRFPALASPPCSKMEDVPILLEKVSLQETLPDAARVPKKGASLFSSLKFKDKSFESFLQESKQRKDIRDLFSSPDGKVLRRDNVLSLEKLAQPFRSTSLEQVARPPSPGGDASSKHIPVGAQVTEAASPSSSATSSSSADEEYDSPFSWRSKEEKILRRRRKLEKATRQLVKQEELKRLYKAQAIQRQLEEVEERQRASEIQGVRLEKALRGEAADSGTQDEAQLLQEWFKLVLEKNKLMRYESELLIMAQELELEDHQSRLEQKLREKMFKEESQKDENDRNEEQKILTEMMQVIEQRDKLVDSLEEQRVKEKAEDQHFESFISSRGCQLSRT
ncbi:MICAL C-terminal protein-like [Marmota monax]|uniref:MICAL C-terminal protein-like n=1 Tax=Marmota monax TaxID=9995 RepID=A0A834PKT5_MARMO|nr:MICAL C-terminal protein-like [Marmota monax]